MPEEFKWNIDWGEDISQEATRPVPAPPPANSTAGAPSACLPNIGCASETSAPRSAACNAAGQSRRTACDACCGRKGARARAADRTFSPRLR